MQADAALAQIGAERDGVQHRAAEAIEPSDLQRVLRAQHPQDDVELRPTCFRAAGVVDVDVLRENAGATSASTWWSGSGRR